MLILTRKLGERITIGDDISITLLEVSGSQVKLGIEAPKEVSIHLQEIYERISETNLSAAKVSVSDLSDATSFLHLNKS